MGATPERPDKEGCGDAPFLPGHVRERLWKRIIAYEMVNVLFQYSFAPTFRSIS